MLARDTRQLVGVMASARHVADNSAIRGSAASISSPPSPTTTSVLLRCSPVTV